MTALSRRLRRAMRPLGVGLVLWLATPVLRAQPPGPVLPEAGVPDASFERPHDRASGRYSATSELQPARWTLGGAAGLVGATPDDTGLGLLLHADYFVEERVSVGPLLQFGFTDDLVQMGVSAQGKYWVPVPGTEGRGRVVLQGGLGFLHADFRKDDTAWLVPLGVGYDYTSLSGATLTATALLNFTDLKTGGGSEAEVMPGLFLGARF